MGRFDDPIDSMTEPDDADDVDERPEGVATTWLLLVYTRPVPGAEDEFDRWYSGTHLTEVLAVPGFTAARRFRTVDHPAAPDDRRTVDEPPAAHVAAFTIRSSDIAATLAEFDRSRRLMEMPVCLDRSSVRLHLLHELS